MSTVHSQPIPKSGSQTLLRELTLSRTIALQLALVGTLGFVLSLGVFSWIFELVTGSSLVTMSQFVPFGEASGVLGLLVLFVMAIVVIAPHELLHGLAISYYGGKPRYGVGLAHFVLPYAYATADHSFTRNQFIVIALAPLVGLTAIGIALMAAFEWSWLIFPLAANAAGAVGDCWMVLTVLGYPAHTRIEDSKTGLQILGNQTDSSDGHWLPSALWSVVIGTAVVPITVYLFVPYVLLALGIESMAIGQPGSFTLLFESTATKMSYSFSVGPGSFLLGAALGVVYAFARSR